MKKGGLYFSKTSLKAAVNYLIENINFGTTTMKQSIGVRMRIDPAPSQANRFLYCDEEEYMSLLIFLIKSRQDITTQQSASLMIFTL